jgi:hypothetical protein
MAVGLIAAYNAHMQSINSRTQLREVPQNSHCPLIFFFGVTGDPETLHPRGARASPFFNVFTEVLDFAYTDCIMALFFSLSSA